MGKVNIKISGTTADPARFSESLRSARGKKWLKSSAQLSGADWLNLRTWSLILLGYSLQCIVNRHRELPVHQHHDNPRDPSIKM